MTISFEIFISFYFIILLRGNMWGDWYPFMDINLLTSYNLAPLSHYKVYKIAFLSWSLSALFLCAEDWDVQYLWIRFSNKCATMNKGWSSKMQTADTEIKIQNMTHTWYYEYKLIGI